MQSSELNINYINYDEFIPEFKDIV